MAALVARQGDATRLEWARDSDYRFFPTVPDALFGYRPHLFDLAANKALAAAGRRKPRDILDLLQIHDAHFPLAAVIFAAPSKNPGFTPTSLIGEIRRNARYVQEDFDELKLAAAADAGEVSRRLRQALLEAEAFCAAMPIEKIGAAFLRDARPVLPDPARLSDCVEHWPVRKGHWPGSPEIGSAMAFA